MMDRLSLGYPVRAHKNHPEGLRTQWTMNDNSLAFPKIASGSLSLPGDSGKDHTAGPTDSNITPLDDKIATSPRNKGQVVPGQWFLDGTNSSCQVNQAHDIGVDDSLSTQSCAMTVARSVMSSKKKSFSPLTTSMSSLISSVHRWIYTVFIPASLAPRVS